jgi:hypothetical protein
MSLSKPPSTFTAGLLLALLAAYLGANAAATERNDHKPAVVTHRTHHTYRLYNGGDRRLTWSQMPPCHNKYITGVPCITSYDRGCWKRNDDDPVEHCGHDWRPIPLGQQ